MRTERQIAEGAPAGRPDERSTASAVRSMFSAVAPRYDLLNHLLSFGFDILWRRATTRALQAVLARSDSLALDLCCGTGDLALELRRASRGRVIGSDFCHSMLQLARQKSAPLSKPPLFLESDSLQLPFADASADAVTSAFGFRNLANYRSGLAEFHRVLKPGGTIAILEFSRVESPIFGPLFRFYFRRMLPKIGSVISGTEGPYQYLPDSVSRFPDQKLLKSAMEETGFVNVRYRNFTGGAAALHLGEKS